MGRYWAIELLLFCFGSQWTARWVCRRNLADYAGVGPKTINFVLELRNNLFRNGSSDHGKLALKTANRGGKVWRF